MRRTLMACAIAGLFLAACSKDKGPARIDTSFRLIGDNGDLPITLKIYGSKADYESGTNVLWTLHSTAANKGQLDLTTDKVEKDKTYFVEWYSDDFRWHNWRNSFATEYVLNKTGSSQAISFGAGVVDSTRLWFLDGDKTQTAWTSVDMLDETGASIWNTTPENTRYLKIIFRRDGTGEAITKDYAGKEISFPYVMSESNVMMRKDNPAVPVGLYYLPAAYTDIRERGTEVLFVPNVTSGLMPKFVLVKQ
ncbi:hypothetical protein ACWKWU_00650 [Chitinophaga lutea]